jgi:outer membrane immunogenic protein
MKFKQYLLAGAALAALSIGSAAAADLPVKAVAPAPVPPPFSWTGWYFGGHLGAGWSRKEFSDNSPWCWYDACTGSGDHTGVGVLGGLQGGYNWQTGNWVFGIEGEYSWADVKGSHSNGASSSYTYGGYCDGYCAYGQSSSAGNDRVSTKITGIGTIAARVGVASDFGFGRTLFFVKGGGAVVRDKYNIWSQGSYANTEVYCPDGCYPPTFYSDTASVTGSASSTRWGWLIGAGLEFALNQNWSAKVEYDYMDFGSKDITFAVSGSGYETGYGSYGINTTRTVSVDQTLHVVKFGVNYRFSGWGGGNWGW